MLKEGVPSINLIPSEDFPKKLYQLKNTTKKTSIELEFKLTEEKIEKLNQSFRSTSRTDGVIKIKFTYEKTNKYYSFRRREFSLLNIEARIKENGNKLYQISNINILLQFIRENIGIIYIPSVRTEKSTLELINNLVSDELKKIEENEKYLNAIKIINELQNEVLNNISKEVNEYIKPFIELKSFKIINNYERQRISTRNNFEVFLDDGQNTPLASKGDGIKSIVALSLIHNVNKDDNNLLLLIDEPEAHLHSGAIRELMKNLNDLSSNHQIIISTHNQIFVNRNNIHQNLILANGKLNSASNVREIRECLEVSVDENLVNSNMTIIVEGNLDVKILKHIIKLKSDKLFYLIQKGEIVIHPLKGVTKLEQHLLFMNSILNNYLIVIDNDKESNNAISLVLDKEICYSHSVLSIPKSTHAVESEIEDIFSEEIVSFVIQDIYNIDNIFERKNMAKSLKFTEKIKMLLENRGIVLRKDSIEELKYKIMKRFLKSDNITESINPLYYGFVDNFIKQIERIYYQEYK